MSTVQTPCWGKAAIFYQIFPDRFASSSSLAKPFRLERWDAPATRHGFKGGDLLGLVERLDHLQDLGINAIYVNPIFRSASNHRYQTYDYYQVDQMQEGNQSLRQLLDAAHLRDLKVVLDGVFNHCGRGFYQFHHIPENGASLPDIDWFSIKEFPLADQVGIAPRCLKHIPGLLSSVGHPSLGQHLFALFQCGQCEGAVHEGPCPNAHRVYFFVIQ
jgi:hypothetical protein